MTIKELETRLLNLEHQVAALASRPVTERAERAAIDAKSARSEAMAASDKADTYEDEITTLALAQEELFTEIIPELFTETEV